MKETRILAIAALVAVALIVNSRLAVAHAVGQPETRPNLRMKPGHLPVLNNIVSIDALGDRVALCSCGQRFTVQPGSRSVERNGIVLYLCDECGAGTGGVEWAASGSGWARSFGASRLTTNVGMQQGLETGTCVCGRVFPVTVRRRAVVENGLVVLFCSDTCRSQFRPLEEPERRASGITRCA